MTEVIADFLERQAVRKKPRRARMSKGMGAVMDNLDAERQKPRTHDLVALLCQVKA
jgi:hypothetical protein